MLKNTNELHTVLRRCPGNCARVLPHRKSFPAHPVPLRLKANTRRRADTDPRACAIQPRAGSSLFRRKVAGWRSTSPSNSRCHSFVWHNMYVYIIERERDPRLDLGDIAMDTTKFTVSAHLGNRLRLQIIHSTLLDSCQRLLKNKNAC